MRPPSNANDRGQSAAIDRERVIQSINDLSNKIDAVARTTNDLKIELGVIKARLFNGLTDTMRETYAKVLILENKQEETSSRVMEMQKTWSEAFTSHDTRDRIFHSVAGMLIALMLVTLTVIVVHKILGSDYGEVFFSGHRTSTSNNPVIGGGNNLLGP